jgi:Predicted transcriptional regulator, BolA superfamily
MQTDEIKKMIEDGLPGVTVFIDGDGVHFQVVVIGDVFQGLTQLESHQSVYRTLGDKMGREIHALSIRTCTAAEGKSSGAWVWPAEDYG